MKIKDLKLYFFSIYKYKVKITAGMATIFSKIIE